MQRKVLADAPLYSYIPSSLSNSVSSWAQYEALRYVSFPAQVLSKSCKIIPVMLVGILVNHKSYPISEYLEAILISSGATIFTLFGSPKSNHSPEDETGSYFGIILLILYLFCDSFTSQWQSKVYKSTGIDQFQMMLGVNFWSIVFTGIAYESRNHDFYICFVTCRIFTYSIWRGLGVFSIHHG